MSEAELKRPPPWPIRIGSDHPSVPGHFPGRPLVAGVLLLEQAAMALRERHGLGVASIVEAKFLAPLEPGQDATLTLSDLGAHRFRFDIRRGDTSLARGIIEGTT
jgi:3-hydroxymyristoyl/3-hydroxydecanoyl-(acyl carrier protein) dehydratase